MDPISTNYDSKRVSKPFYTPVPKQKQPVHKEEIREKKPESRTYFPQDQVNLGKVPQSVSEEKKTPEKPKVTNYKAQTDAVFSSSAGYIVAESVQLPNRLSIEEEKKAEGTSDSEEGAKTGKGKKEVRRNLKKELQEKRSTLKEAVNKETFEEIDEEASLESSLERFKRVRQEMKSSKPVTKEEEEESRVALRILKKARKDLRGEKPEEETLRDIRLLTEHFQTVRNSYNKDKRERQLGKIEEQLPGGSLNYVEESFFLNGTIPSKDMVKVAEITRELEKEKSSYKIEGNKVEVLGSKDIWQRKMNLLDEAIEKTRSRRGPSPEVNVGNIEVDVEYYELGEPTMLKKLKDVAGNGGKVRVLMDGGRLNYKKPGVMDASQIAYRMETMSELQDGADNTSMGIVLFPTKEQLGSTGSLMHRKLLRVGDKVIMGGMNANSSSGENVDYAKEIEGPAARRLTEIYKRDVENSTGKTMEEIYGEKQIDILRKGQTVDEKTGETKNYDVILTSSGLRSLFCASIPQEKRSEVLNKSLTKEQQIDRMIMTLAESGIDPTRVASIPDKDRDGQITPKDLRDYLLKRGKESVTLTDTGRKLMADRLENIINRTNSKENKEKLADISPPDSTPKGKDTLAIGDLPEERQAILLHTINSAKEFIYIPAFVLTKDIAEALIAKKQEMKASKKNIDIKVILDPGLYPHGGTPNEPTYKLLEDNGISVRWALLDRTTADHDRKVHAKMMVTDNAILSGSTNFSGKGMRDNWEMSDVMLVDDKNPESLAKRDKYRADFKNLWDKESIDINTKTLAEKKFEDNKSADVHIKKDEYRNFLLRLSVRNIENYEKEVGMKFSDMAKEERVQKRIQTLISQGMDKGYATLQALGEIYPSEKLEGIRKSTEGWQALSELASNNA